jgi:hypothetical protein
MFSDLRSAFRHLIKNPEFPGPGMTRREDQTRWSEMSASNVLAWLGGALVLCAAVVACWFPARPASRIDPIVALRAE